VRAEEVGDRGARASLVVIVPVRVGVAIRVVVIVPVRVGMVVVDVLAVPVVHRRGVTHDYKIRLN
jgi:hypothetical protein